MVVFVCGEFLCLFLTYPLIEMNCNELVASTTDAVGWTGQGGDHVNVPGSGGKGKGGGGDRKPGAHSLPLGSELFSFLRDHWEQLSLGIAGR